MAEIPLKTLKLHGLDNTYYIPDAQSIANQALNDAKSYTNGLMKKAAPRNLLDNSDFTNPVNQRGQNSYMGYCYSIDRWQVNSSTTLTVMDGFCRLSGQYNLWQTVPVTLKAGKTYTCAARIKASEGSRTGWLLVEASVNGTRLGGWSAEISDWTTAIINFTPDSDLETAAIQFTNSGDASVATDIEWAALYEGEYTTETLPDYQSKGYGVELLECQRYFVRISAKNVTPYPAIITGGAERLGVNLGNFNFRATPPVPTVIMSSDFLLTIRLGSGGFSEITGAAGAKPAAVYATQFDNHTFGVYFDYGSALATNNSSVTVVISDGYLDISVDL